MRIDVVTIFPDYFDPLRQSLLGKAIERGVVTAEVHDLRQWTNDVHRTVDDTPYGGGAGMVMRPEPWGNALDALCLSTDDVTPQLIVPTPSGTPFDQKTAETFASQPWLIFACGRYEGIDYRVIEDAADRIPVHEVSIGDYVLAGGEVASLVMIEAITRLLPGVVGNAQSVADDSFSTGLLEGPVYTRPPVWRDREVPPVLLSGNHAGIARWRRDQALHRTALRRSDLIDKLPLSELDSRDREIVARGSFSFPEGDMAP